MSDTPETDAVVRDEGLSPHPYIELARRLERERDEARAAMQHEREGYECAIAYGYAADAQRERAEKAEAALADLKIKMTGNSRDYEVLLAERDAEIARLREDAEAAARAAWDAAWDAQAAAGATAVAAGATAGAAWAARAAAWDAARKDFNKLIRDTK